MEEDFVKLINQNQGIAENMQYLFLSASVP